MTVTDIIIIFFTIFFLNLGASRGFIKSLLGPFSVVVTTILSIIYYQHTKDATISLLIGLLGPFLLHLFLKLLLKTWVIATNSGLKPDFLSQLGGAVLTFMWGGSFIFFALILIAVLPPWGKTFLAVHNDVKRSISYNLVKSWGDIFLDTTKQNLPAVTSGPSSPDTMSLAQDPRFQTILQDPEIQKEIQARDYVKLMSNPKVLALTQQIMSDPATMKKVMAVYSSSQAQIQASKNP